MASTGGGGLSADDDELPPLVRLDAYKGVWSDYIEAVYAHFKSGLGASDLGEIDGLRIALAERVLEDNKERTFWHIITKDGRTAKRTPDVRRCERICWVRHLLDLARDGDAAVAWWSSRHRQERRIRIALADFSYVVVLAEKKDYVLLITAFPVDFGHERRKLRKQWEKARKG